MSFLVTGCARSGTGYISIVLYRAGVYCSHERRFGNRTMWREELPDLEGSEGTWGESSMWAPPVLGVLPEDLLVFHQVRNPVKVLRSYLSGAFPARGWIEKHTNGLADEQDPLLWCFKHWLSWNMMVEPHADYRYRVEDVSQGSEVCHALCDRIGIKPEALDEALAEVPRTVGTRSRLDRPTWDEIPESVWKRNVLELAAEYGYSEAELKAA